MISVRRNVFETNSSSTHSITMCSEDEYNKWKNGELLYNRWGDEELVSKEQIIQKAKEKKEKFLKQQEEGKTVYHYMEKFINATTDEELYDAENPEEDSDYCTYDEFFDNDYLESFEDEYITKSGEKIIAFGLYGYDG